MKNNFMINDDKGKKLVNLARSAVEKFVKSGEIILPPPSFTSEYINIRAGVFVCIKNKGQLRGCIGTIEPTRHNIVEEVIHNAIAAAVNDYRFLPISSEELSDLSYTLDILEKPEPVIKLEELDPKKFGVIVSKGLRKGVLLPNLQGVDDVSEQLRIAREKAGISPYETAKVEKFAVKRFSEDEI